MFGLRQEQRTHRQQFMNELNQGVGALRRAAGHLASGTAEHLTPTYDRARAMAGRGWESTRGSINPMYQSLRENAAQMRAGRMSGAMGRGAMGRGAMAKMGMAKMGMAKMGMPMMGMPKTKAKKKKNSRLKGLASLLAAGAAVGAAGAAVARRRRNMQEAWEEYDPMTGQTRYYGEGSHYGEESAYGRESVRERVASGATSMAHSLSERAGRIADTMREHGPSGAHAEQGESKPAGGEAGQAQPNQPGPNQPGGSGSSVPGTTPMPPGNPLHGPGAPLAFPDEP